MTTSTSSAKRKTSASTEPREHDEQVALVTWFRAHASEAGLPPHALFSVPNGGHGVKPSGMFTLRQEGLLAGVADLFLAVPRFGCGGLWIELKRQTLGRQSADQKAFQEMITGLGYRYILARGAERAAAAIEAYIGKHLGPIDAPHLTSGTTGDLL